MYHVSLVVKVIYIDGVMKEVNMGMGRRQGKQGELSRIGVNGGGL